MSLGSIVVRLTMNTADFETDAGRAARVAERRAREIDAAFKKAGVAIGAALGAGMLVVGAAFRKYVQNTIEAEKVQAQLTARIKDTGAAAGRTLAQLNEQADKLQSLTVFDDEAIGEAQAMLLTFKQIQGVQFDKTVESALDLATVMGTDATDAAKLLGKALADPEKGMSALSRAGVVFTEAERDAIKAMAEMGDVAGAQDAILSKLQGTMGSAAEAARGTLGGALDGLRNAFDNLLEGDTGGDGVRGTVKAINDLSDMLGDPSLKQGISSLASGLLQIAGEAIKAVAWLGNAGAAVAEFYGDTEKQSRNVLQNRRTDLETQLFGEQRAQRRSWLGASAAENAPRVKELKAEIAAIDAQLKRLAETERKHATRFSPEYERASLNFNPNPSAGKAPAAGGRSSGSRAARPRVMPDFLGEDQEASRRAVADIVAANEQFERMAATLAGPLASAEYEHQQNQRQIAALGLEAERSTSEVTALKELEVQRYNEQRKAIEATIDPMGQLLAAMQSEIDAIGLSNGERAMMNILRERGIDLASAEAQAYMASARAMDETYRQAQQAHDDQVQLMDAARQSFKGFVTDIYNSENAWDAAKKALDRFGDALFDLASSKVMEQLFGQMGSSQTGSAGNWIADLIGAFAGAFSGGGGGGGGGGMPTQGPTFARGGYTGPGGVNDPAGIVHRGEVVWSQGDVARAGGVATVEAMRQGRGGRPAMVVEQHFHNPRLYDRRSDTQRQAQAAMKLRESVKFA